MSHVKHPSLHTVFLLLAHFLPSLLWCSSCWYGTDFTGLKTTLSSRVGAPSVSEMHNNLDREQLFCCSQAGNPVTKLNNLLCLGTFAESVYSTSALCAQMSLPPNSNQCKLGQISTVNYKLDPKLEGHRACYSTSFPPPLDGKLHRRSFLNKSDFIVKLGHWRDITSLALILK